VIFVASVVVISLVGRVVWKGVKAVHLGWLDRLAGVGFGLAKGIVLSAGLLVALVAFLPSQGGLVEGSRLAPHVLEITREVGRRIPGSLGDQFRNGRFLGTGAEQGPQKDTPAEGGRVGR
jgi:uncharacterized membrane protein required for colicin V production